MTTDDKAATPPEKRVWTTPRLCKLGTIDDVEAGGAQSPSDAAFSPSVAAS